LDEHPALVRYYYEAGGVASQLTGETKIDYSEGIRVLRYMVRVLALSRGELNEGDFVLNREKHAIFDTTNCVQGTYVM
jgi:hypothetical protein